MNRGLFIFKYIILSIMITVIALLLFFISKTPKNIFDTVSSNTDIRKIIIDAGHGGKDGGAISVTGSIEKELNLDISLKIGDILELLGYDVIYTRTTDTELKHEDGGTRKMQDLKGRLQIAENNADVPFISIHMNKFPIEKYYGTQVYYSNNNSTSLNLSQAIMKNTIANLQPKNTRKVKMATSNIYLLDKIKSPAVLIECGFLSNQEESGLLDIESYRTKLSIIIANSFDIWYNEVYKNYEQG